MTFVPGVQVFLRSCFHGEPGIVRGFSRGRVLVDWSDLGIAGVHRPERLVIADSVQQTVLSGTAESISCARNPPTTCPEPQSPGFGTRGEKHPWELSR